MCVKNNAPPVESHCGAAENATDNYTALPKSMPAGRAPGEGELAGRQVTVTLITSLGCRFSPPGCLAVAWVCNLAQPSLWAGGGFSALPSFGKLEEGGGPRDNLLSDVKHRAAEGMRDEHEVAHPAWFGWLLGATGAPGIAKHGRVCSWRLPSSALAHREVGTFSV